MSWREEKTADKRQYGEQPSGCLQINASPLFTVKRLESPEENESMERGLEEEEWLGGVTLAELDDERAEFAAEVQSVSFGPFTATLCPSGSDSGHHLWTDGETIVLSHFSSVSSSFVCNVAKCSANILASLRTD